MELITADKDTVTIKMNRQDEFAIIRAIFMAVHQEYDQLDREILNCTLEQVKKMEQSLWEIRQKFPARG